MANTLTESGSGYDIWGRLDQFHFAYTSLSGDGGNAFYGIETGTQSRKPAYTALHEAAYNQPLSCSGC